MNSNIALIAFIEIASSLSMGLFILWLTYRGFQLFGKRYFKMKAETNVSYSIVMASVLLSVGYSMSSVIQPLVSSFRLLSNTSESASSLALSFILHGSLYIGIAYLASITITVLGILIYTNLTPLKEFEEIQANNIGVAIVVSSIVITLSLISHSGVELLLESIVPYPTAATIN
ncbi:MAG: hypothetical protein CL840_02435 [Crocinitomicaceae bacterium]|nr:hypothetical protein [Crocinitomicaceae bacterium]|tara:strand:- start:1251 stop:1772 length:522 start_codon:yes stop_codon:yes gene_type:complete